MSAFTLQLLAADRSESIDAVRSFVGEDASGSFGLLAGHERFITVLTYGLARWQHADGRWEYLGLPGGVLYFVGDACRISTRRYLRDFDVTQVAQALGREMLAEEQGLRATRNKLHQLERGMLQQMAELGRE